MRIPASCTASTLLVAVVVVTASAQTRSDSDPRVSDYRSRIAVADSWIEAGNAAHGVAILEQLRNFSLVRERARDHGALLMKLARIYASVGDVQRSYDCAYEAYLGGFRILPELAKNRDLNRMLHDSRFQSLLAAARSHQLPWDRLWSATGQSPWQDSIPLVWRIQGVAALWAAIKYNYAYFDRATVNWDSAYQVVLNDVMTITSPIEYYRRLQKMVAALGDG